MKVNGFKLESVDGIEIRRWVNIPGRVDLPTGDVVFGADTTFDNNEFRIVAATWEQPEPVKARAVIRKSIIVARLHDAGMLETASKALNESTVLRERWYVSDRPTIYSDDKDAIKFLSGIGADPAAILKAE